MPSWYRLDPAELLLHDASLSLDEEAFGALMRLSFRALAGVPIRDDEEACRRACGTRCRDWPATWAAIRRVLVPVESVGIRTGPCASRELSWEWIERLRGDTSRRLSADRERKKKPHSEAPNADPPPDSDGIRRTPSDSALRTDGRTDEQTRRTDRQTDQKPARKLAGGDAAELTRHFEAEFLRTRGAAYVHGGAKDGTAAAWLVKSLGLQEARRRATAMLDDPDAWIAKNASLAFLRAQVNRWAPSVRQAVPTIQSGPNRGQPSGRAFLDALWEREQGGGAGPVDVNGRVVS